MCSTIATAVCTAGTLPSRVGRCCELQWIHSLGMYVPTDVPIGTYIVLYCMYIHSRYPVVFCEHVCTLVLCRQIAKYLI